MYLSLPPSLSLPLYISLSLYIYIHVDVRTLKHETCHIPPRAAARACRWAWGRPAAKNHTVYLCMFF